MLGLGDVLDLESEAKRLFCTSCQATPLIGHPLEQSMITSNLLISLNFTPSSSVARPDLFL